MARKNHIQHVEWRSKDAPRLQSFYGSVFAWKFKDWNGYAVVDTGDKDHGGGIMQLGEGMPMPPGVTNYITVEDLAPYEEKIKSNGGQIFMSNQEVPGMGWFSVGADPDGNSLAIWKSAPRPKAARKAAKKAAKATKKAAKKAPKPAKKAAVKKPVKKVAKKGR